MDGSLKKPTGCGEADYLTRQSSPYSVLLSGSDSRSMDAADRPPFTKKTLSALLQLLEDIKEFIQSHSLLTEKHCNIIKRLCIIAAE